MSKQAFRLLAKQMIDDAYPDAFDSDCGVADLARLLEWLDECRVEEFGVDFLSHFNGLSISIKPPAGWRPTRDPAECDETPEGVHEKDGEL